MPVPTSPGVIDSFFKAADAKIEPFSPICLETSGHPSRKFSPFYHRPAHRRPPLAYRFPDFSNSAIIVEPFQSLPLCIHQLKFSRQHPPFLSQVDWFSMYAPYNTAIKSSSDMFPPSESRPLRLPMSHDGRHPTYTTMAAYPRLGICSRHYPPSNSYGLFARMPHPI